MAARTRAFGLEMLEITSSFGGMYDMRAVIFEECLFNCPSCSLIPVTLGNNKDPTL